MVNMWNTFVHNNETFLIKIVEARPYKISLSNMIHLWTQKLSNAEIVQMCKVSIGNYLFLKSAACMHPLFSFVDNYYIQWRALRFY